jgi:cytochrome P450
MLMVGVDKICAALTFAIWDLARLPECRKKAAEEVVKFFPSREDMTAEALKALPFLNAFLMESMRFHSVSGDKWERESPDEGATIGGYQIPKGVFTLARQSLLNAGAGYLRSLLQSEEFFDIS